jgi:hypothetical protein
MLTKKFFAILIVAMTLGYQCKNDSTTEQEHTESAIPPELKDSTVINADEDNALEKLKNVVGDSTQVK